MSLDINSVSQSHRAHTTLLFSNAASHLADEDNRHKVYRSLISLLFYFIMAFFPTVFLPSHLVPEMYPMQSSATAVLAHNSCAIAKPIAFLGKFCGYNSFEIKICYLLLRDSYKQLQIVVRF